MGDLISKLELAKRAGVSPATITGMCKPGKRLYKALVGKKVNPHHPLVLEYMDHRRKKSAAGELLASVGVETHEYGVVEKRKPKKVETVKAAMASGNIVMPEMATIDVRQIQSWPFREVIRRFGSDVGLKDCVTAMKTCRDIERKEIDISDRRGDLVSKEKVDRVFSIYDESNSRMLDDMPTKLAAIIRGVMDKKPSKEKLEEIIRRELSKETKGVKNKVTRAIKSLRPKKDEELLVEEEETSL